MTQNTCGASIGEHRKRFTHAAVPNRHDHSLVLKTQAIVGTDGVEHLAPVAEVDIRLYAGPGCTTEIAAGVGVDLDGDSEVDQKEVNWTVPANTAAEVCLRIKTLKHTTWTAFTLTGVRTCEVSVTFEITDLGVLPGGSYSGAKDINNSGQVVGRDIINTDRIDFPQVHHAFLWSSGSGMQPLGTLPGEIASIAYGINDSGQVVGDSGAAFLWSSGSGMQPLGIPGSAMRINNMGQVVGDYELLSPRRHVAFLWSIGSGIQELGIPSGATDSYAFDINDSSQVVGESWNDFSQVAHAFLWSSGSGMQPLGTLPGAIGSSAFGINNSGQVVGESGASAFLWSSGSGMQDLGTVPGAIGSIAYDINDSGQVIGWSRHQGVDGGIFPGGFFWSSWSGMQDLSALPEVVAAGWTGLLPSAINNAGQIVGEGVIHGQTRAFLLSPSCGPN
jgi:probable HAF family extracellular repeat protein